MPHQIPGNEKNLRIERQQSTMPTIRVGPAWPSPGLAAAP